MTNYFNPNNTNNTNNLNSFQSMPNQFVNNQQIMSMNQNLFMQPIGNVYNLNTTADIDGVPVANQMVSVGVCMNEKILHIKTFQNGVPMTVSYKLIPLDAKQLAEEQKKIESEKANSQNNIEARFSEALKSQQEHISQLEQKIGQLVNKTEGVNMSWQL